MSEQPQHQAPGSSSEPADSSAALIAHIQAASEQQKALLARELHDELGGLLVGAVMDVAWAEQHVSAPPAELKQKLVRARQTLSAAIDLKRRLIEELRPTLLDNVGLFAALRWHVQATCKHADLECRIELPDEERRFLPNIPIALFRIVQEAFALMMSDHPPASAEFSVVVNPQSMTLRMSKQHKDPSDLSTSSSTDAYSLAAIKHRAQLLKGEFTHTVKPSGSTHISATFPLDTLVA